jgi:hypothetical protein
MRELKEPVVRLELMLLRMESGGALRHLALTSSCWLSSCWLSLCWSSLRRRADACCLVCCRLWELHVAAVPRGAD